MKWKMTNLDFSHAFGELASSFSVFRRQQPILFLDLNLDFLVNNDFKPRHAISLGLTQ